MADWKEVDVSDPPVRASWWRQHDWRPIPDSLREVFDTVVPDKQTSRPLTLRFGYEPKPGGGGMFYAWVDGEEEDSASGTDLDWCESHAERLVEFADWLQDQVIPESHAAWGEASPPCPGHTHPADPLVVDDEAWWTCPRDGSKLALIGQLG